MTQIIPALVEGLVWSALWAVFVLLLIVFFPWLIEHDYPPDVRACAHIPPPAPAQKHRGIAVTVVCCIILIGTLAAAGLVHYGAAPVSFGVLFLHLWIICFMWNVVDLLILDWLVVCTVTPKWMVLPGTQHCKGYRDYRFHFTGFLHGCVYMTLFGLLFAGVDYAILYFFFW